jgi:putative membrane protein
MDSLKGVMMKGFIIIVCMIASIVLAAKGFSEKDKLKEDVRFAATIAEMNMMQIQLGSLALRTASSLEVRELGRKMMEENASANEALRSITLKKDILIPDTPAEKKEKRYDQLAKLNGIEFDKEYIQDVLRVNRELIKMCRRESEKGQDAELKSWASLRIQSLEHSIERAKLLKTVMY